MSRAASFLFFCLLAPPLGAQAPAPPATGVSASPNPAVAPAPTISSLTLRCTLPARPDLAPETLRLAIERELGTSVVLSSSASPVLDLVIERSNEARVRFITPESDSLERSVELPQDAARAVEVIAWVAGNLARDEASELIAQYRRKNPPSPGPIEAAAPAGAPETAPPRTPPRTPPKPPEPPRPAPTSKASSTTEPSASAARLAAAPINLSLFHPLALYPESQRRKFALELGLAYGRVGALGGVGLELGMLKVDGAVTGVALSGLALDVGGPTTGYTASVFYSGSRGDLTGVDMSFVVFRRGNVSGAELATAFARADRVDGVIAATGLTVATDVRGANLAAGVNIAASTEGFVGAAGANIVRRVEGASLAAGANVGEEVHGLVASAGANVIDRVEGASLAAGANVSQDVSGVQIAIVNVAERVRGAQIGVINIAREVDGASVGVVSIAKNGEIQATAWASNFAPLHGSLKFRVGYAYSEFGAGYDPVDDEYFLEQGLGAHIPLVGPVALEPGVHHSFTKKGDQSLGEGDGTDRLHYRVRATLRLARHFDVFGGGGIRHAAWGDAAGETDPEVFAGVALH